MKDKACCCKSIIALKTTHLSLNHAKAFTQVQSGCGLIAFQHFSAKNWPSILNGVVQKCATDASSVTGGRNIKPREVGERKCDKPDSLAITFCHI
jgi:hypothetical protein